MAIHNVGLSKQLFVDDAIVESVDGPQKALHQAYKHPDNPVVPADRPWERSNWIYGTVIRDEDTGLYRMRNTNLYSFQMAQPE